MHEFTLEVWHPEADCYLESVCYTDEDQLLEWVDRVYHERDVEIQDHVVWVN